MLRREKECLVNSTTHCQCKMNTKDLVEIYVVLLAVLNNTTLRYSWYVDSALYLMSGCLFPASGRRSSSTGVLENSGTNGYYWVASPNSAANGYNLNFNSTAVNASNNNTRSTGMPVRPVQAFTNANRPTVLYLILDLKLYK